MTVGIVVVVLVLVLAAGAFVLVRRRRAPSVATHERTRPSTPATPRVEGLAGRIRSLFRGAEGEDPWARLEELLVRADVGPATSARIVAGVRARYAAGADPAELAAEELVRVLGEDPALSLPADGLGVVMVVGVNGSGKTTTIGKLAARLGRDGRTVSLAGSDTFRAAASEQLDVWAKRAGAHMVSQDRGADPGSVAFDAVKAAQARGADVLIVDTAGRLHTKQPLMEELRKVRRVLEKAAGRPPDETLLVLDATTGQNGVAQARAFTEAVEVTGVALTKLDGTAKGGIVLAVREQLGVPVKLVGTGESAEDLEPFRARAFADRLLGV
jgi:fused signal recognition particle receptor